MSYAIIRNTKYKRENLKGIFRHNERRNKNYSNENIDKEKSHLNYQLKSPQYSYEKEFDIEWKYKSKIKSLEKENNNLHKIIDKFYETIDKFINWICKKFDMGAEDNLVRDFQKETNTYLDAGKQIKQEEREKEIEIQLKIL